MNNKALSPITHRIYEYCKQNKISQTELAKRINKTQSTISAWGQRGTEPPAELLEPIANALNISVEWLITGKDTIEPGTLLPEQEQLLLDYYHAANQEGQERIIEQAEFLSAKYPKLEGKLSNYKIG